MLMGRVKDALRVPRCAKAGTQTLAPLRNTVLLLKKSRRGRKEAFVTAAPASPAFCIVDVSTARSICGTYQGRRAAHGAAPPAAVVCTERAPTTAQRKTLQIGLGELCRTEGIIKEKELK